MNNMKTWSLPDLKKVVKTLNSSTDRDVAVERLARDLNRTDQAVKQMYYVCRKNLNTEISDEKRERAIRRLLSRGFTVREAAKKHGLPIGTAKMILKSPNATSKPTRKVRSTAKKGYEVSVLWGLIKITRNK